MKLSFATPFLVASTALLLATSVFAGDKFNDGWDDAKSRISIQSALDKDIPPSKARDSQFDVNSLIKTSMSCGFPPFPPLGCKNPTCICDQNGANCRWIFQCN